MIHVQQTGYYVLSETKKQTKILELDAAQTYAWINAAGIGEILVTSKKHHPQDCVLARGAYRLYEVRDEPDLTDLLHLELCIGPGYWQGYLLPTGLPTDRKKKNRIIPTKECITRSEIHEEVKEQVKDMRRAQQRGIM